MPDADRRAAAPPPSCSTSPGRQVGALIDATATVTEVRVVKAVMLALDPLLAGDIGLDEVLHRPAQGRGHVRAAARVGALHDLVRAQAPRRHVATGSAPTGPGPFGILQTLADGIKFFFKEDLLPDRADRRVFILAPFLSLVPAFLVFSVIPIGGVFTEAQQGTVEIFGHDTYLQLADPPIGVLLILACSSIAVYGVMLAGWSSGSKYPLLGSVRASAQMVSYEAALGLSVVAVVLLAGSLSTHDIVMTPGRRRLPRDPPPLERRRHRRRARSSSS